MNRSDLDTHTVQALIASDPAPVQALTVSEQRRATETLERILRQPDHAGTTEPSREVPVSLRPQRARRVAILASASLATATIAIGAQLLSTPNAAYASWTPTPTSATTTQEAQAVKACRNSLMATLNSTPQADPGALMRNALPAAAPFLAEQRGDWTMVVLGDSNGLDATCVTETGSDHPADNSFTAVANRTAVPLGPRDIRITNGGSGGYEDHLLSLLVGYTGKDITALTVRTRDHGTVQATLKNGRVAAWWPGPTGISANDPTLTPTTDVTITYADGTTQNRRVTVEITSPN